MSTPPTNNNPQQPQPSQYERRLARQRQLDAMEAEASGAMPGMELNIASNDSDSYTTMRQRNHETARRFMQEDEGEEEVVFSSSRANSSTAGRNNNMDRNEVLTQSLFGSRPGSGGGGRGGGGGHRNSVNLMDHEAGIYQEQDHRGLFGKAIQSTQRFFLGRSSDNNHHHHHDAAEDADAFINDPSRGDRNNKSQRGRGRVMITALSTICLGSRRRRLLAGGFLMVIGLILVVVAIVMRAERLTPEERTWRDNALRFHGIQEQVLQQGVSHTDDFKDAKSAESRALRWLAYSDPARVDPHDAIILQRYALAVLFYKSFMAYEVAAGEQKPIEMEGQEQYQGVPNAGWRRSDYWLSEKGICLWYGVECEAKEVGGGLLSSSEEKTQYDENSMVLHLNLTSNQVYGQLTSSLKALSAMETLDLSHNDLQGPFPSQAGYLFNIKKLYLHKNRLTGTLPADIGFLESIQDLDLGANQFRGAVPSEINRLYTLHSLVLEKNQFTGQMPWVSKLSQLEHLSFADNQFNGTFPFTVARLSNIQQVHAGKNQMIGTIHPEIETLTSLRVFAVQQNLFTGRFPNGIFERNPQLQQVSIQDNQLKGSIPSFAGQLNALTTLQMHNNLFTGSIPEEWTNMTRLEILHLQQNQIHGPIPSSLQYMTSLREFWANDNDISGRIPTQIAACTNLQQLFLNDNQISGPLPQEALGALHALQTLRLEQNKIRGDVIAAESDSGICRLKNEHVLSFLSVDCNRNVITCECCDKCY